MTVKSLISSNCEQGPCYSGHLVCVPSMPHVTDLDRVCAIEQLQADVLQNQVSELLE